MTDHVEASMTIHAASVCRLPHQTPGIKRLRYRTAETVGAIVGNEGIIRMVAGHDQHGIRIDFQDEVGGIFFSHGSRNGQVQDTGVKKVTPRFAASISALIVNASGMKYGVER